MRIQSPKPALLDVDSHAVSTLDAPPAAGRDRRFVAFVIDGGTAQITRYTVTAPSAAEVRQRLEAKGLLVRYVLPRWAYWSLVAGTAAAGLAAIWGVIWVWGILF